MNCTPKVRQKKLIFEGVFYDENSLSTVQSIITISIFHVNIKGLWYNDIDIQGGNAMTLDVNEEELTILGISFDNYSDFDTVWYAIGSSMIENYEPTVQDVIDLKTYVTNRRKELNIG